MRRALVWLKLYGSEAVRHKLKNRLSCAGTPERNQMVNLWKDTYLFSALYDLISSLFGLNKTPICPLTLVTHIGKVGVFILDPKPHFSVLNKKKECM